MSVDTLIEDIKAKMETFISNMDANAGGNKSAGVRARKASLELERLFRQYRAATIAADKK